MSRLYKFYDEYDEKNDLDKMLEMAFKEGCEHGYRKAMRESSYDERTSFKEGYEETIERLKKKYR